ncbi:hypothetical protein SDC9_133770 [bioreactor metagenome]|uniref:Uncharacterized protein n=1 Tax=bioreactor metagenome TaxID=1076179 RepID=A0A645DBT6_9ZZZZ
MRAVDHRHMIGLSDIVDRSHQREEGFLVVNIFLAMRREQDILLLL